MNETVVARARALLVRGLAVTAVVLTYAAGSIGTQVLSAVGISSSRVDVVHDAGSSRLAVAASQMAEASVAPSLVSNQASERNRKRSPGRDTLG